MPQKGWSLLIFPDQTEASGGAIELIASRVGRNDALTVTAGISVINYYCPINKAGMLLICLLIK